MHEMRATILLVPLLLLIIGSDASWSLKRKIEMTGEIQLMNEGITYNNDRGEYILSGREYLLSSPVESSFQNVSVSNKFPIPEELKEKYGYDHIGDIDYIGYDMLLAPYEEPSSKVPGMAVYNATTLTMLSFSLAADQQHNPWVALRPGTNLIFSSEFNNVTSLISYAVMSWNPLKLIPAAPIVLKNTKLEGVQGGTFDRVQPHILYMSTNTNDTVFQVDIRSGSVEQIIATNEGNEMEGITYVDGNLFFFENYGPKCELIVECPKYIQQWTNDDDRHLRNQQP